MCSKPDNSTQKQTSQETAGGMPRVLKIERNAAGQIVAHLAGRDDPVVDARVVRCFPWSVPDSYICVRNADGKEVGMLTTLDVLDKDSREIAEHELRDKIFNPKILRVVNFKHEFGVTQIEAETDRGPVTFQIRSRDDIRILSDRRALFRDTNGNTYELPDVDALDRSGRRYLQRYF